jgi:hypothetical protein
VRFAPNDWAGSAGTALRMAAAGLSEYVGKDHPLLLRVLGHRLSHGRVCARLWAEQGLVPTLAHIRLANDLCVASDVLHFVFGAGPAGRGGDVIPRWPECQDVVWLTELAGIVEPLLRSRLEEHVTVGITACECACGALKPLFAAVERSEDLEGDRGTRWLARDAEPHVRSLITSLAGLERFRAPVQRRASDVRRELLGLLQGAESGLGSTLSADALRGVLLSSSAEQDGKDDDDDTVHDGPLSGLPSVPPGSVRPATAAGGRE